MPFTLDDEPAGEEPVANESAEIMENMPEPQQHAIEAAQETVSGSEASTDVDASGTAWDPSIHATGADGAGVKTAAGNWRKRRGAPKRASQIGSTAKGATSVAPAGPTAQEVATAQAQAAGTAAAMSIFAIGRAFGGEEWQPTPEEVMANTSAWSAYFVAKGITDFPPGLAVCIATAGYAGPRLFMPATRERVGTLKQWFAVRVAKWRVKKALKKAGVEAVVTIKGAKSADVYDHIMVNGVPFKDVGLKVKPER